MTWYSQLWAQGRWKTDWHPSCLKKRLKQSHDIMCQKSVKKDNRSFIWTSGPLLVEGSKSLNDFIFFKGHNNRWKEIVRRTPRSIVQKMSFRGREHWNDWRMHDESDCHESRYNPHRQKSIWCSVCDDQRHNLERQNLVWESPSRSHDCLDLCLSQTSSFKSSFCRSFMHTRGTSLIVVV